MADWFAGPGGSPANSGQSWPQRKATITQMLGVAWNQGDRLIAGPGVYRERVHINREGGNTVLSPTATVTNESTTVTSSATAGIAVGHQMLINSWEEGNDGSVPGASWNFTSASANFQNGMIGYPILIINRGAYTISSVTTPNVVVLADPNGLGQPAAGASLSYCVPSGETPYEVASVDSGTQFTLVKPWSGPTLTGMAANCYRMTQLLGDESGHLTDGIGGVCRITGSDNDTTGARNNCIWVDSKHNWFITGFRLDSSTDALIRLDDCDYVTIEDCRFINPDSQDPTGGNNYCVDIDKHTNNHVRRCVLYAGEGGYGVYIHRGTDGSRCYHVVENCYIQGHTCVYITNSGACTVKNLTSGPCNDTVLHVTSLQTGDCAFIQSSEVMYTNNVALWASANGEIIENWNNLYQCSTDIWIGTGGANSTDLIWIPNVVDLVDGFRYPAEFLTPSQWSPILQRAGLNPRNHDLFGIHRPGAGTSGKRSWGCFQDRYVLRDTAPTYGGQDASMQFPDARRKQFRCPVNGASVTASVWVYLGANYAGTVPAMIIKQPGQATRTTSASGATGAWEQLSDTFTPSTSPPWIQIELMSDNTAGAGDYTVNWQYLAVI